VTTGPSTILARIPEGLRVYAVGDIHGRLDLLDELLGMIARDNAVRPRAETRVIFLGDYVDRGPDSKGVIERLAGGLQEPLEGVFLCGNHEDMMLRSFSELAAFAVWTANGGLAALESYGVSRGLLEGGSAAGATLLDNAQLIMGELAAKMPPGHLRFLIGLQQSVTLGDYFFVHAGVRPDVPLDAQAREDCLYIRGEFLHYSGDFGKIIVHGHTPAPEPDIQPNRIGIDTLAFRTGRLTALRLEGTGRGFLVT
jgi:serine/threonine protein phosphatase 1